MWDALNTGIHRLNTEHCISLYFMQPKTRDYTEGFRAPRTRVC